MRVDFKIAQIGLILVGVPLLFELVFVGVLTYLVGQAEYEIKRQAQVKEILFACASISSLSTQCATNVAAYSVTRSNSFLERYSQAQRKLRVDFDELEELLKSDREHLDKVRDARSSAEQGLNLLTQTISMINHGSNGGERITGAGFVQVRQIVESLTRKIKSVADDEVKLAEDSPRREQRARHWAQVALAVGIALNFILAGILVRFFSKQITSKLNLITQNAERVPRGETLNPALKGADEISQVDRAFHNMAEELNASRKMQQYLIAMVSHDLRSPLTSLQGVLTLLAMGAFGELPPVAKEKIESVEEDASRLIKLTNDLLDTERLSSGKLDLRRTEIDSSLLMNEAADAVRTFAEQHGISVQVEALSKNVKLDHDRIQQVLVNFLTNAIKYSPAKSTVKVSAEADNQWLTLAVEDCGRGVPKEHQARIFEKFQQVEESDSTEKGGKGLGLAICKSIVEEHGGQIGVTSEGGKGSRFWFKIPIGNPTVTQDG